MKLFEWLQKIGDAEVNLTELDDAGMNDHEKLGYALVNLGYYDIPKHLSNYIDYEVIEI